MNCPNCGERPVGILYSFKLQGVSFKESLKGYFKCRQCGTLLRHKKNSAGLPEFDNIYWFYSIVLVVLIGSSAFYIFGTLFEMDLSAWILVGVFVLFLVLILGIVDELRCRYWVIERVPPEKEQKEPAKLTVAGVVALIAFVAVTMFIYWAFNKYFDMQKLGLALFLIVQLIYFSAVVFGVLYLFDVFSKKENKEEMNAVEELESSSEN
jgi:amino acid transporter